MAGTLEEYLPQKAFNFRSQKVVTTKQNEHLTNYYTTRQTS